MVFKRCGSDFTLITTEHISTVNVHTYLVTKINEKLRHNSVLICQQNAICKNVSQSLYKAML